MLKIVLCLECFLWCLIELRWFGIFYYLGYGDIYIMNLYCEEVFLNGFGLDMIFNNFVIYCYKLEVL